MSSISVFRHTINTCVPTDRRGTFIASNLKANYGAISVQWFGSRVPQISEELSSLLIRDFLDHARNNHMLGGSYCALHHFTGKMVPTLTVPSARG